MNIVYIQVHQRAACLGRIEYRRDVPLLECLIATGILGEIQLHNLHIAQTRKQLPNLFIVGVVLIGNGLKENQPLCPGQLCQFLRLFIGHRKWFFQNHMLPCLQGLLCEAVMQVIGHRKVQYINRLIR